MDKRLMSTLQITNVEEPVGNFLRIFPKLNLTREEVIKRIELTGKIKVVAPLEYFANVGNGMNTQTQKQEITKIIPSNVLDRKQRAKIALDYIDNGNHIGVSREQYEKDLKNGKNHDETMKFFLGKFFSDEKIEPCVVVEIQKASELFGYGVSKVILDGTHRAVAAAIVNSDLEVLEFSID